MDDLDDFLQEHLPGVKEPVAAAVPAANAVSADAGPGPLQKAAGHDQTYFLPEVATLAMLPVGDARLQQLVVPLPTEFDGQLDRYVLLPQSSKVLRAEVREWMEALRTSGVRYRRLLQSISMRDVLIDRIITRIMESVNRAETACWAAALPTGRQLVIAPQHVLEHISPSELMPMVHRGAVLVAAKTGDEFDTEAFRYFSAQAAHGVATCN